VVVEGVRVSVGVLLVIVIQRNGRLAVRVSFGIGVQLPYSVTSRWKLRSRSPGSGGSSGSCGRTPLVLANA
jgi:hypothetical protein